MNCKNCGFPLNGNQTCPSCGALNEINNNVVPEQAAPVDSSIEPLPIGPEAPAAEPVIQEQSAPVTPEVPVNEQPSAAIAPELPPIQPSTSVDSNYTYQAPKKNNTALIVILIIVGLLVVGAGIFVAIKFLGNRPDTPTVEEPKEEEKKVEKTDEEKDAKYAKYQIFIDKMTEKELFKLINDTLDYQIVDGETTKEFYNRLAVSKLDKEPSGISGGIGMDYEFDGVILGSTKRDYINKIHIGCEYDFSKDVTLLYNPKADASYVRSGGVYMTLYDHDRAEKLYESMKSQYSELYPGVELKETKDKDGDWSTTDIYIDKTWINIHVEHKTVAGEYATSELRVSESINK